MTAAVSTAGDERRRPAVPRPYVVTPGEDLFTIARQHGFEDWRPVFLAACNAELRRLRPEPEQIRPGDRLRIPPPPDQLLQAVHERIAGLHGVRAETVRLFEHLDRDLVLTYGTVDLRTNAVEYVARLFLTKVQILKKGFAAMTAPGGLLAWSNSTLAGCVRELGYAPIRDLRVRRELDELGANEGVQGAVAPVARALIGLATPVFWAEIYTNVWVGGRPSGRRVAATPESSLSEARAHLHGERDMVIEVLDGRLREAEGHLEEARKNVLFLYGAGEVSGGRRKEEGGRS